MGSKFFNVILKKQTYLNLFYLLISFPLGIFYFALLVTGISTGLGLIITLLGIPLLVLMTIIIYGLGVFENKLTSSLLGINLHGMSNHASKEKTIWKKLKKHLSNTATWKSLLYLLIKFPLGIFSFVVLVTLLSVSLGFISTPLIYHFTKDVPGTSFMTIGNIELVTNYWNALIFSVIGIFFLFISLHILNGVAYVSGLIAKLLLSGKETKPKKSRKRKK